MKKLWFTSIKESISFSYIILIVLFCFAMATSYISISYMAKYSSSVSRSSDASVARFVIKANSLSDTSLQVTPTENGNCSIYEFTVTNSDEAGNSEVSQLYGVGLLVPTDAAAAVLPLIEGSSDIFLQPILLCTDVLDVTADDIYNIFMGNEAMVSPDILEELEKPERLLIYDYFDIMSYDSDYVTCSWLQTDDDGNPTEPAMFYFNAGNAEEYKHFIVFAAGGVLSDAESYHIPNMQVVVYSEQLD